MTTYDLVIHVGPGLDDFDTIPDLDDEELLDELAHRDLITETEGDAACWATDLTALIDKVLARTSTVDIRTWED